MYTIQAMWTAAHHEIGAKFVVCNNRSYQLLKLNVQQYWRERGLPGSRASRARSTSASPAIRFDELAQSMGVPATRVETPDEVAPAIAEALADDGPFLIDLMLHQEVPGPRRGRGQPPPGRRDEGHRTSLNTRRRTT